ncbi:MAG: hypothetical protein FWE16_04730 [Firmicutes bacterium]|nr:hypothetical protein [Bacillota bacterium]
MRRLLFFIILASSIGFSALLVLFHDDFWAINTGSGNAFISENGWDKVWYFVTNITNHEWAWNSANFLLYSTTLFAIVSVFTILLLVILILVNIGNLARTNRLYVMAGNFYFVATILTGAYIWRAINVMSTVNGDWGIGTLPIWFYVPIVLSIVLINLRLFVFRPGERDE